MDSSRRGAKLRRCILSHEPESEQPEQADHPDQLPQNSENRRNQREGRLDEFFSQLINARPVTILIKRWQPRAAFVSWRASRFARIMNQERRFRKRNDKTMKRVMSFTDIGFLLRRFLPEQAETEATSSIRHDEFQKKAWSSPFFCAHPLAADAAAASRATLICSSRCDPLNVSVSFCCFGRSGGLGALSSGQVDCVCAGFAYTATEMNPDASDAYLTRVRCCSDRWRARLKICRLAGKTLCASAARANGAFQLRKRFAQL